jgi:hypothetical protein
MSGPPGSHPEGIKNHEMRALNRDMINMKNEHNGEHMSCQCYPFCWYHVHLAVKIATIMHPNATRTRQPVVLQSCEHQTEHIDRQRKDDRDAEHRKEGKSEADKPRAGYIKIEERKRNERNLTRRTI